MGIVSQKDDYDAEIDDVNEVELCHLVYFSRNELLTITPKEKNV